MVPTVHERRGRHGLAGCPASRLFSWAFPEPLHRGQAIAYFLTGRLHGALKVNAACLWLTSAIRANTLRHSTIRYADSLPIIKTNVPTHRFISLIRRH